MHTLGIDVNKSQWELPPVVPGWSDDGNDTGPTWPRAPKGRDRKDVQRDPLGSVRKREKHIPLRKKGICLKEKWLYWGEMSYLMKPTNGKGSKLPSLRNIRKIMFMFRRRCYDLQL